MTCVVIIKGVRRTNQSWTMAQTKERNFSLHVVMTLVGGTAMYSTRLTAHDCRPIRLRSTIVLIVRQFCRDASGRMTDDLLVLEYWYHLIDSFEL